MSSRFHALANPTRFLRVARYVLPICAALTVALLGAGLWYGLFDSPADYQQAETVRIMYVHVPAAWMAMFCYAIVGGCGIATIVWRHPLASVAGSAAAPIGAAFTLLALATGSLWGKPMWGTWWVWDARLTSVLLLFFVYLGYIALQDAFDDRSRGERAAALLGIVGLVLLPVIKFSVDWWNSLHQPASVMRLDGPTIDPAMLVPLLLMAAAYQTLFLTVWILGIRSELIARRIRAVTALRAAGAD